MILQILITGKEIGDNMNIQIKDKTLKRNIFYQVDRLLNVYICDSLLMLIYSGEKFY